MQAAAVGTPQDVHRLSRHAAFVVAASSFVFVFAAAGTPVPLFNTYRLEDGITKGQLGMVTVAFFVAAATALLVLGRLSNHLGRRPVALLAIGSAALSCVVLMGTHGALGLTVGRVLQGLACGLTPGALGSYVIDSAPPRPRWLPAAITGTAPMVGVPLGALAAGALVQFGPAPRVLVYAITALVLVTCGLLVAWSPETMPRRPGALASLRPRLQIPKGSERLLVATGAAFVTTWSFGGFYQAFGPAVAAEYLGAGSPLLAATVFASVMVLNPLGGSAAGRLMTTTAVRVGMGAFIVALVGVVVSLRAGASVPFIAASLIVGAAQGLATTAGLRGLLAAAKPDERAGLLATIYLVGYGGGAIPGIVAGRVASRVDLLTIASGYAVLGAFAAVVAMIVAGQRANARGHSPTQEGE